MIASSLKDSTGDAQVEFLLSKNADPNAKTSGQQTALHFASSKGNLDTVRMLLAKKGSARNKDRRGQLPLHRAAAVGHMPITKLLLESRSPVNASDMDGWTALHHGEEYWNTRVWVVADLSTSCC